MIIKKRTLYISILIIAVLAVIAYVAYNSYSNKKEKELKMQDLIESYEREIDREYRRLVDRMDRDAKSAMNSDYSYDFRRREIREINEMFDGQFYFSTDPFEFRYEYESKRDDALKVLKSIASSNVFEINTKY